MCRSFNFVNVYAKTVSEKREMRASQETLAMWLRRTVSRFWWQIHRVSEKKTKTPNSRVYQFVVSTPDFPSLFKKLIFFYCHIPSSNFELLDWHRYSGHCSNVSSFRPLQKFVFTYLITYSGQYIGQSLTDFQNSFDDRLSSKFAVKWWLQATPHLVRVATLPCEIVMSGKKRNLKQVLCD